MRKFQILKTCIDKRTGKMLTAGMIVEADEARAAELEKAKAYCSEIKAAETPEEPKTEEAKAAPKKRSTRKKKDA